MARMVALHGLDAPVWHVWRGLNDDCPNREGSPYERCSLHSPTLAKLVCGDLTQTAKRVGTEINNDPTSDHGRSTAM